MNQWKGKSLIQSVKIWLIQIYKVESSTLIFNIFFSNEKNRAVWSSWAARQLQIPKYLRRLRLRVVTKSVKGCKVTKRGLCANRATPTDSRLHDWWLLLDHSSSNPLPCLNVATLRASSYINYAMARPSEIMLISDQLSSRLVHFNRSDIYTCLPEKSTRKINHCLMNI